MTARAPAILISAGEVSGDIAGAQVARAVLRLAPSARLFGLGGRRMAEAGVSVADSGTQVGVIGLSEALAVLPQIYHASRIVRTRVLHEPPDVAVLIGNDLFNACLGRWLRRRGVPTIAFCPPQVWVWRSMLRTVAAGLTRVLATFPEEGRAYEAVGIPTTFVGHHLADALREVTVDARADARRVLGLRDAGRVLAILPGSRRHELRRLGPALLTAARAIARRDRDLQVVVAAAEGFDAQVRALVSEHECPALITADSHAALRAADAAVCCSGTATLEASLLGIPMAVVYRTSWTTYAGIRACIATGIFRDDTIALPNLVLGRTVVRELKQAALTPAAIVAEVTALLDDPVRRDEMRAALRDVRAHVNGEGTMERVASIVLAAGPLVGVRP